MKWRNNYDVRKTSDLRSTGFDCRPYYSLGKLGIFEVSATCLFYRVVPCGHHIIYDKLYSPQMVATIYEYTIENDLTKKKETKKKNTHIYVGVNHGGMRGTSPAEFGVKRR